MRVLVVEDEKKTASFIRKALQGEGFAVDVCHNGDDALADVNYNRPHHDGTASRWPERPIRPHQHRSWYPTGSLAACIQPFGWVAAA